MKLILITGCAGFIGSSLSHYLLKHNYKVIGIDDLSVGLKKNLPKNKNFRFIKGDCGKDKTLNKLRKKKINATFHLAGQSSGEKSFFDPKNDFDRNVVTTMNILKFHKANNIKHFIYASSMSVYGNKLKKVNEFEKCRPISFYGLSKLTSEKFINMFSKKKLKFTIVRLFNVYGQGQRLDNLQQGMIRIYLTQILKFKSLKIKGSVKRYRDFVYISDVLEIFRRIINNDKCYNKTFNLGYGKKYKISDLVQMLRKKIDLKFKLKIVSGTPYDQFGIVSNSKKIFKAVNYKPKINLSEGLNKFLKSLKSI